MYRVRETLNHGHVRQVRVHRISDLTDRSIIDLFARLTYPVTFDADNRYHRQALWGLGNAGTTSLGWTDLDVLRPEYDD